MAVFKIKIQEFQEIVGFDSRQEAIDYTFDFLKKNLESTDPNTQNIISIKDVSDTDLARLEDPDYVARHSSPVTQPSSMESMPNIDTTVLAQAPTQPPAQPLSPNLAPAAA